MNLSIAKSKPAISNRSGTLLILLTLVVCISFLAFITEFLGFLTWKQLRDVGGIQLYVVAATVVYDILLVAFVKKSRFIGKLHSVVSGVFKRAMLLLAVVFIILFLNLILFVIFALLRNPLKLDFGNLLLTNYQIMLLLALKFFFPIVIVLFGTTAALKNIPSMRDHLTGLEYAPWGGLSRWGRATRGHNQHIGWLRRAYENLNRSVLQKGEYSELIAVSPSANAAIYEAEIAKNLSRDLGVKITFHATDVAIVGDHVSDFEEGDVSFRYQGGINAEHLPSYLRGKGIRSVHMIWDIKGFMWYRGCIGRAEEVFRMYHELLAPSGIFVIEAHRGNAFLRAMNELTVAFGWVFRYAEKSTFSYIEGVYRNSEELQGMFEQTLVSDPDHTDCDLVVYKKRSKG
jgi:hypothetical protein